MDLATTHTPLSRLQKLESALLALLQEVHSLRADVEKQSNGVTLEALLDAEDVAKILGLEVEYVYSQARAGIIPSVKLGKFRKFSPSQLKKWLDRRNASGKKNL
jgi:excisionase family DNA binding protein